MSDQTNAVAYQAPGQAPKTQATPAGKAAEDAGQAAQPQYITADEFKREIERVQQEAEEKAFRRAQGLIEKKDQRVRAELKALENALKIQKQAGIEISPEQEASLRNQVISQVYQSDDPPPEQVIGQPPAAPPGQAEPPQAQLATDPITAEALRMVAAAGVTLDDDDPEVKLIKSQGTPWEFLTSVQQAIDAKLARTTSTNAHSQSVRTPTNLGGGGAHKPNPIETITDPATLIGMGLGVTGK